MPKIELNDRFIATVKPNPDAQVEYFDELRKGLSLLVSPKGTKTWFLHYTAPGTGKRSRMKLGVYPEISLGKARGKAKDERSKLSDGADPLVEKRAREAGQTVSDLVDNYLARKVAGNRSVRAVTRRLHKNVSAVIGDVKLAALHRRDITRCVDGVKDRGAPIEANRVFEDMRAMVRWARGRGDLDSNLMEGMAKPSESKSRERVLTADEIRAVWAALPHAEMRESTRRIIRLLLITGQRESEVAGMTRAELDLDAEVWTIPPQRAKNGHEHHVPLSALAVTAIRDQLAAVEALAERKGRAVPPFVFPGPGARAAVTGASIPRAVKREEKPVRKGSDKTHVLGIAPWTPHDLRRTAATMMEEIGVSPFVIGHVLNHISATKASITSRVYAKYDYAKEKRAALDLWAGRLTGIVEGRDNVIQIARA